MADKRPIGFAEASTVAGDDYLLIDGQTNGTRKVKPGVIGKTKTSELTNDAGFQTASEVSAAISANIDNTLAVSGKAADAKKTGDEITHVKQDINELEEGKADASGTYENLTAGNAEQLLTDKGITDKVPYLLRASGGNGADREQDKIVGGTVAWNQLCNDSSVTVPSNHKYYMIKSGTASIGVSDGSAITGLTSGTDIVTDLTQMFGTAIADRAYAMEQATAGSGIAWLKSMGFFQKNYYPYDAGTLKSVEGLTVHSMVGFNQWDEEWELGALHNIGNNNTVRSKNFIPVIPNNSYYFSTPVYGYAFEYGADQEYLGIRDDFNDNTKIFAMSANTHYVKFVMGGSYGTTYNHDICINLSDPAKNGTYEPYTKHSYPLDSSWVGRGVLKLDSNYQIYYDGDEYYSDGKVKSRYDVLDLGAQNWYCQSSTNRFLADISTILRPASNSEKANMVCAKYLVVCSENTESANYDKVIGMSRWGTLVAKDTSFNNDVAAFKAALSGVPLVYEKKTLTIEEADPYQNPQILDPYGTEAYETTGIVPVGHETFYPENLRFKIEGLPFNFATLIAPTETSYKATRAYSTNNLFIVDNILYKATTSIASGGTITPGTNCTATTLAEIIAAL